VVLLTLATRDGHPLNGDFLHRHLSSLELVERDTEWGRFFSDQHQRDDAGPIVRLIDWAWSEEDKAEVPDDTLRLAGSTLAWLFISSDRRLRDRATKALVWLVRRRPKVMAKIVKQFAAVNDPYVAERVYAAAYGCALYSTRASGLRELALIVYEAVFAGGCPPPDILLRAWAQGVVEYAQHVGVLRPGDVDMTLIVPPHRGDWPKELPTIDQLQEQAKSVHGDVPDWLRKVIHSVSGHAGDFGLYIIGTNAGRPHWTDLLPTNWSKLNESLSRL
jgi:hypothetical protein